MRRQIAYCMDCMDFMKLLPDKAFDLAIVDPPYVIGAGGAMGGDVLAKNKNYKVYSGADKASPEKVYFDELKRVSKNQIIFGANYMTTKNKR